MHASPEQGTRIQRALMSLTARLNVTHESFARHLSAALGRGVDRSLVTHWASGTRGMPVDAVVELARHAAVQADDVEEAVAERVLAPIAEALGCVVIRIPADVADAPTALVSRLLTCMGEFGRLQQQVASDLADGQLDHPREALEVVRGVIRELHKLETQLEAAGALQLRKVSA
jgi:hypothetical protein